MFGHSPTPFIRQLKPCKLLVFLLMLKNCNPIRISNTGFGFLFPSRMYIANNRHAIGCRSLNFILLNSTWFHDCNLSTRGDSPDKKRDNPAKRVFPFSGKKERNRRNSDTLLHFLSYEKPTASCCVETVGFLMMIDFSNYFYGFFSSKSYTV